MAALRKAGSKESRVQAEQNPRAALEKQGRKENTNPNKNLESRHNGHRGVVVRLDEGSNRVSDWVAWGFGPSSAGRGPARLDGRDDVAARVGRNVEDGVDSVGQQREGVLGS